MNTNLLLTFLFLTLPLLFHTNANATITQILGELPAFSTFNRYLTESGIANEIQSREPITVLVVENHAMELLTGKPKEVVKKIMSVHVVLDYLDLPKLAALNGNTSTVATLFQASGQAIGEGGLLKVTGSSSGQATFFTGPSGGSGSNVKSTFEKPIAQRPYTLSVVQVSNLIIPPGIEKTPNASAPAPANAPGSSQTAGAPGPAHANAPGSSQTAGAPGSAHANAPGSSQTAGAPGPAHANAPSSSQIAGGPGPAHANAPGSPHHSNGPSASGNDDSSTSGDDTSPSAANGPDSATTPASAPNDSGSSPAEAPDAKSFGVRIASSISLNTVLATRLLVLAVLWMI